jgi:nitrite reductase (NO-forming)
MERINIDRRSLFRLIATGAAMLGVAKIGWPLDLEAAQAAEKTSARSHALARVIANPTNIPPPIKRDHAVHHDITLEAREVVAEIEPGATFKYMTFDGQVPGPLLRVRQGDTVKLTLKNPADSVYIHSVDMHAIYGTGGGSAATTVLPGQSKSEFFKAMYPGAFIYHCAVEQLDFHISSGMYGMILVEPPQGLPKVDREFYLGQNEVYTVERFHEKGLHRFDAEAMVREQPTYVLFNGAVNALTPERFGAMQAKVGETIRVFMVNGGPNLTSSFHPIGNVWARAWQQGALASEPMRYLQTSAVAPGSAFVGELELPVPETIKLVDHALSRVTSQGLLAEIQVTGRENPEVFRGKA